MEHAGHADVMGVSELASKLGWQVNTLLRGSDDLVVSDIFRAHLRGDFHVPSRAGGGNLYVELFAADEFAIGDFLRGVSCHAHDAVLYNQIFGGCVEPNGSKFEQFLPGGCGSLA